MGLAPDSLAFDCADTLRVASFWGGALGFGLDYDPDDGVFSPPLGAVSMVHVPNAVGPPATFWSSVADSRVV